jgi:staphylococcal nuclease domain-containing protein 1
VSFQVAVVMEYSRKVTATDGPVPVPAMGDARIMDFGSVFLQSGSRADAQDVPSVLPVAGQPDGINVAEMAVARGFATVVKHRDFEDRSNYYDALLAAEARARKGKKGLHSEKEPSPYHINDLSGQVRFSHHCVGLCFCF